MTNKEQQIKNHFKKVDKTSSDSGCWLWTGALDPVGYPFQRWDGKLAKGHRVAYEIHHGEPAPKRLFRTCGNKLCVNPEHFTTDSRVAQSKKLSETDVAQIKYGCDDMTQVEIAERFGIAQSMVSQIKAGKLWKTT